MEWCYNTMKAIEKGEGVTPFKIPGMQAQFIRYNQSLQLGSRLKPYCKARPGKCQLPGFLVSIVDYTKTSTSVLNFVNHLDC